jgi:hypothetical protein
VWRDDEGRLVSRCRVAIELELQDTEADAFHVIDRLLDEGVVQDAINETATDLDLTLEVTSAVSVLIAPRGGH